MPPGPDRNLSCPGPRPRGTALLYLIARQAGPAAAHAISKYLLLQWERKGQDPYEDAASFRRLFRRLTRVTPGEYRRKFRLPSFASGVDRTAR